jgi:hypothetical protein
MSMSVSPLEIATLQRADMSPYLVTNASPEPDHFPERLSKNAGSALWAAVAQSKTVKVVAINGLSIVNILEI